MTKGFPFMDTGSVKSDWQPLSLVYLNEATPFVSPVTVPFAVTVATDGLLLTHVPPLEGNNVVEAPAQIILSPLIPTVGFMATAIDCVAAEMHPVDVSVKIKPVLPKLIPCTIPVLVTVATDGLRELQLPPVEGNKFVDPPMHIVWGPEIPTVGPLLTVIIDEGFETHPVIVFVKVNVTVPKLIPFTTPAFVTVATEGLLLTHTPPDDGRRFVSAPRQIEVGPDTEITGLLFIVIN